MTPTELLSGSLKALESQRQWQWPQLRCIKAKMVLLGLLFGLSHNKMHLK